LDIEIFQKVAVQLLQVQESGSANTTKKAEDF
jgi:hypothetical protein